MTSAGAVFPDALVSVMPMPTRSALRLHYSIAKIAVSFCFNDQRRHIEIREDSESIA
jgi:hypothetical protein